VTRETIYGFIAAEKTTYPGRLLQVSTSAFYDWIGRGSPAVSDADLDDARAADGLHDAWVEHGRTYGARRLAAEIRDRGQGWTRKKVARLMTVAGIEGIRRRSHDKNRSGRFRLRWVEGLRRSGSRRWLNQPTWSRAAISTCSTLRQGARGLISSVLNSPIADSASTLTLL
jgi:HTH-like domain